MDAKVKTVEKKEIIEELKPISVNAINEGRQFALIATFVDGFTQGWKMAVPSAFKDALDIKRTPVIIDKKETLMWTQGHNYDFHEGDMIHSAIVRNTKTQGEETRDTWADAMKTLELTVQVISATPSVITHQETIEVRDSDLEVFIKKKTAKTAKEKRVDGLTVHRKRLIHGSVRFQVFRPNQERSKVVKNEIRECTQDDFIAFLQSGLLRVNGNQLVDLFSYKFEEGK